MTTVWNQLVVVERRKDASLPSCNAGGRERWRTDNQELLLKLRFSSAHQHRRPRCERLLAWDPDLADLTPVGSSHAPPCAQAVDSRVTQLDSNILGGKDSVVLYMYNPLLHRRCIAFSHHILFEDDVFNE
jgi:hypothetical protein